MFPIRKKKKKIVSDPLKVTYRLEGTQKILKKKERDARMKERWTNWREVFRDDDRPEDYRSN